MLQPLWQPTPEQIESANMTRFRAYLNDKLGTQLEDYAALYQWSIDQPEAFWSALWDESGVIAESRGAVILADGDKMPGAHWFPEARLNFAENLLRRRDEGDALIFWGEDKVRRRVSYKALYDQVSQVAQALKAAGITEGDRVAGYLPNMPEAAVAMLAVSSLGAIWSSCSPDFGVNGVVDRFGQIEPKILFAADGYFYNGKTHDSLEKIAEIQQRIPSLEKVVIVPYTREAFPLDAIKNALPLPQFVADYQPEAITFKQLPFDHPLYIMFSSGTTGVPKCIVHGAGGTLLQHLKEHRLHTDVKPGDRTFFFTTCGWMMWNWLISGLAAETTVLLYDGSPFYPDGNVLFDYADAEKMTQFGTSAKFIDAINKAGLSPKNSHNLSTVRTLCSTGSPLVPEAFDFVYEQIKQDMCLSSISGGTDIISCFALGNPVMPVYRGELQCRGLAMQVEVWNDEGEPVRGEKGELVCTRPFPSMPIGFWNDPEGEKYHSAYFDRFPNVWCHGDYVELTEQDGIIIYGRSDAVLNPGGVRIGTAEIYRQVEQLESVVESLVIGQEWEGDVRVVLFVRLRDGLTLDDALIDQIKKQIRANTTPRHVPARVVQVSDIPRTKSGKIVELAVREVVHNRPVKNKEALANPEALELFANRPELQS
ncbi:MAG: acetoacetate--CoA ligase [Sedimenticola thiotaurini]|uniref:Acetoacetate--CoA ligase n=1 Tax=Sedimenticola thiotaurini TaxID=1543721 RepID=A0A558CW33_9GAMM|nr:MAG: acetoacetate--CoA ligase [Sedimenticola thiotaurini]